MTCRKGCGRTTTSCRPMWSEASFQRLKAPGLYRTVILMGLWLAFVATAHAQSTLADRIQAGDRKKALEMIAAGANVNQAQPDGTTPLHWATYRVDRELIDRLLKRGAKANVVNRYGASPLHEAVRLASPELTGILLEAGADANAANDDGMTALMIAARTGNVTVAELLV